MNSRLAEILAEKRKEVERLRKRGVPTLRGQGIPPLRDFRGAISGPEMISLIAEIKFTSPSAGLIRKKTDPLSIARTYEEAGAAALSLVTDYRFFGGEIEQLPRVKRAISLPILRKDFIIDARQVTESFLYGADAVLLIARILSWQQLQTLLIVSRELGLAAVTEIHDREDLKKALDCGAEIIGINNRDLDTFEVSLHTTLELAPLVPKWCPIVSESGITGASDITSLQSSGIQAVLVGSSLMRSNDMGKKTRELVNACKIPSGRLYA
jgi:indole-3-glycerol phosphate synthase